MGAPKMKTLIAAVLGVVGIVTLSCVALEVTATRTPPSRGGQAEWRGADLQRPIPPAITTRITRTWPRTAGSRSATAVAGVLGSWLWLGLSRRKARASERLTIWCDAAGPRGPPVRAFA